ncbi:MAG: hypothetical protein WA584_23470 [Pyrinomonadaceae bacterium]
MKFVRFDTTIYLTDSLWRRIVKKLLTFLFLLLSFLISLAIVSFLNYIFETAVDYKNVFIVMAFVLLTVWGSIRTNFPTTESKRDADKDKIDFDYTEGKHF